MKKKPTLRSKKSEIHELPEVAGILNAQKSQIQFQASNDSQKGQIEGKTTQYLRGLTLHEQPRDTLQS